MTPAGPAARRAGGACRPGGPCGPVGPAGSWPGAKSDRSSDLFATFAELIALFLIFGFVTALFLSCGVPTLFLASCVAAAMLVPPSATSSARQATTIAGEGRRKSFLMSYPFLGGLRARLPRHPADTRAAANGSLTFPVPQTENRLEVLACTPPGAAVDVPLEPIDEAKTAALEDLGVEVAAVVDDDDDGRVVARAARDARRRTSEIPADVRLDAPRGSSRDAAAPSSRSRRSSSPSSS